MPALMFANNIDRLVIAVHHSTLSSYAIIVPSGNKTLGLLWAQTDWPGFAGYFHALDWESIFTLCHSADDCWNEFVQVLNVGINLFVPAKSLGISKKTLRIIQKKLKYCSKKSCFIGGNLNIKKC